MKCPKCGFNSFEFLDSCKKCGANLVSFKKNHGIDAIIYGRELDITSPPALEVEECSTAATMPERASLSTASPASPPPLPGPGAEEEMAWDFSASDETAPETEPSFSGFELDFMKDDVKQQEHPEEFSFAEESAVEDGKGVEVKTTSSADDFSDFSFYEETIDPKEMGTGAEGETEAADIFGETGVIGEILPEQLQSADQSQEQDEPLQQYDNEFVLDDFSEEPEELTVEEVEEPEEDIDFLDLADLSEESQVPHGSQSGTHGNEFVFDDFPDQTDELTVDQEETQPEDKDPKKDPLDLLDFDKEFESLFATDEPSADGKGGR